MTRAVTVLVACRVMFGSSNLFVVHHPDELAAAQKSGVKLERVTYDQAQEEIARQSGFDMEKTGGKSKGEPQGGRWW